MNAFILDLWHDLRAKRLAPVAVALLIALVAAPVMLMGSSGAAPPAPVPPPDAPAKGAPLAADIPELRGLTAVADTAAARGGSTFDLLAPKNPFRPPAALTKAPELTDLASVTTDTSGTAGIDLGGSDGGSSGDSGGFSAPGGTGGAPFGDVSPSPAPLPPAPSPPSGPPVERAYVYVADVTFATNGRARRYRSLDRVAMLPSPESPLLLFLGVADGGDNATFLVDSTLKASGEGNCSPSESECAVLSIGPGSIHRFTDAQGNTYLLQVDEIRRVPLSRRARAAEARQERAAAARSERSGDDGADAASTRRFEFPLIPSFITVSTPPRDGSSGDPSGR